FGSLTERLRPRRAGSASKHRAASHLGVKNGESRFTRAPSFDPSGEGSGGIRAEAPAATAWPDAAVASASNPPEMQGIPVMEVRGARVHNLTNIYCEISPYNRTVET